MRKYLDKAKKAWARATIDVKKMADAYVCAVFEFGDDAKDQFKAAFPMFGDREWRRLELIGRGALLPQFFFKSDFFIGKLLKMRSSMRIQRALVGASNDGLIRIDRGNGPEKVFIEDLAGREDKALVMLLSEENEELPIEDLMAKYRKLVSTINKSVSVLRPAWEIRADKLGRPVVHFNRACNMSMPDMVAAMETHKCWNGKRVSGKRTSEEILEDILDAIKDLAGARDSEWDFAERHGIDGTFWTDEEEKEHQWILDSIAAYRERVNELAKEATGKDMEI